MSLPLHITLLVLFAALMHAAWNAIVKSSASNPDPATPLICSRTHPASHACLAATRTRLMAMARASASCTFYFPPGGAYLE